MAKLNSTSILQTTKNKNKPSEHTQKKWNEINMKAANKLHLARADCFVGAVSFKAIAWLAFVNKYLYMALTIRGAL